MTPHDLKEKLELPLIVAPMFLISDPAFALAACKEGVVGSFPALNVRTSAELEQWLIEMNVGINELKRQNPSGSTAPYAVNLISHKSNARLQADLDLIVEYQVPVVITSLGLVPEVIERVHAYGGIVLHDVTNAEHAAKAVTAGVDGLIAVCDQAGGHAGKLDAKTLMDQIRSFYSGFVALAGGLNTGDDIVKAQALGADVAYMGTRFLCTQESRAPQLYKQMIVDSSASDILYVDGLSVAPANFMRASLEKAGFDIEQLKSVGNDARKLPQKPASPDPSNVMKEPKGWKDIWSAGRGVEQIHDIPTVHALIARLKKEFSANLKNDTGFKKPPPPPALI